MEKPGNSRFTAYLSVVRPLACLVLIWGLYIHLNYRNQQNKSVRFKPSAAFQSLCFCKGVEQHTHLSIPTMQRGKWLFEFYLKGVSLVLTLWTIFLNFKASPVLPSASATTVLTIKRKICSSMLFSLWNCLTGSCNREIKEESVFSNLYVIKVVILNCYRWIHFTKNHLKSACSFQMKPWGGDSLWFVS